MKLVVTGRNSKAGTISFESWLAETTAS